MRSNFPAGASRGTLGFTVEVDSEADLSRSRGQRARPVPLAS